MIKINHPLIHIHTPYLSLQGAHGIARVYLDGVLQGTVDLYAPTSQPQQQLFLSPLLAPKGHLLVIQVTGERNPSAADSRISFDVFEVTR